MSELMDIIQAHLDQYGVTRAEFSRRAGATPQTVHNWNARSSTLPTVKHLQGVSRVTGVPYVRVLGAALRDAGYLSGSERVVAGYEATEGES